MKILILGYGKEGQALEKYFKTHKIGPQDKKTPEIEIWQDFTPEELLQRDYSPYDIIFRSPSVPPYFEEKVKGSYIKCTSITKYFIQNCHCPVIGVTATKGKGTTCSFIYHLLKAHGEDAYLVGNIGEPAINILDKVKPTSVVVYEMSSFQLWDLLVPPQISVIGTIEPDHLNVHKDYAEYKDAKANICRHQTSRDVCIYYQDNPESVEIAKKGERAFKFPYPFEIPEDIKAAVKLPGEHNKRNAIAAIAAVAFYLHISPDEYLREYKSEIITGLSSFKGLPHRLEFIKEVENVKFYDDNFSTNPASTRVAIEAFPNNPVIPIIGGLDKTNYEDLPEIYEILNTKKVSIPSIVLMGDSGHELAKRYQDDRFILAESLEEAVKTAFKEAKKYKDSVVLMSPAAASFDMFKNVYDRGEKYQKIVMDFSKVQMRL